MQKQVLTTRVRFQSNSTWKYFFNLDFCKLFEPISCDTFRLRQVFVPAYEPAKEPAQLTKAKEQKLRTFHTCQFEIHDHVTTNATLADAFQKNFIRE